VFYNAGAAAYTENSTMVGFGSFSITPVSVPEPLPPIAAVLAVAAVVRATTRKFHITVG